MNGQEKNVVEMMIGILTTPIAKKRGVFISADDCKIWVEELEKFLNEPRQSTPCKDLENTHRYESELSRKLRDKNEDIISFYYWLQDKMTDAMGKYGDSKWIWAEVHNKYTEKFNLIKEDEK